MRQRNIASGNIGFAGKTTYEKVNWPSRADLLPGGVDDSESNPVGISDDVLLMGDASSSKPGVQQSIAAAASPNRNRMDLLDDLLEL